MIGEDSLMKQVFAHDTPVPQPFYNHRRYSDKQQSAIADTLLKIINNLYTSQDDSFPVS